MDSASTSDEPDASAATNDNHPEGTFSHSIIHHYHSQKSYPANFAKEDKRALRKIALHFACQNGAVLRKLVSRVSVHTRQAVATCICELKL